MMTRQTSTILLLMTLVFASCSNNRTVKQSNSFVFPDIVDSIQTAIYYFSPTLLTTPINSILAIEKIGNKVNLRDRKVDYESFADDYSFSDTTNNLAIIRTGLSIFVDTTREVSIDKNDWGLPLPFLFDYIPEDKDNTKSKTQMLIDSLSLAIRQQNRKENRSFVRGFPVYIVNNSEQPASVDEQDGRLMIIQEALDTSGKWKPIEFWQFSRCGNSYGDVSLHPNNYIMTKVFKYKGVFETMLRLKMRNDSIVYYSQPFRGSINLTQMDTALVKHKFRPREFFYY